ncbi:FTR1 family iron permease [Falsiroseomonas sp. HW251]|uniref:FTR1 family iron permease n=1 Tax=Falsiroseomonas sp. HW251 TaxID=3390998 RepID=UPI003D30F2E6
MSLALDAALILLREGLEAVLVLAALAALLIRVAPDRAGALYWGAGAGILASLVAAALYAAFLGGAHDDRVEAITCFLAAGLMLWTGGWLARSADPRAWSRALQAKADKALAGRNVALAVGAIGFLAVFREGAETVLFLAALGGGGQPLMLALGIGVAAVLLVVLWMVISRGAVRLPLRPMFLVTSVFLLVMAARFAAAGVQELQEQTILPFTPIDADWLEDVGLPATWEALGTFIAVLLVAIPAFRPRPASHGSPRAAAAE